MKKPYLNQIQRKIFHTDTHSGAQLRLHIAFKHVQKEIDIFMTCKLWGLHDWTCAAEQGIPPTTEQLKSLDGFYDFAKMYCKRCNHISELSNRKK